MSIFLRKIDSAVVAAVDTISENAFIDAYAAAGVRRRKRMDMTIDERLERLAERRESPAQLEGQA